MGVDVNPGIRSYMLAIQKTVSVSTRTPPPPNTYNYEPRLTNSRKKYTFPPITPLPNFNHETTDPIQLRPFKPKYHLTMGLTNIPLSDFLPIDNTYKSRLALRSSLISNHRDTVIGVSDDDGRDTRVRQAVEELYAFVIGWYLPSRYPSMFRVIPAPSSRKGGEVLENKVTGDTWPTTLANTQNAEIALEILGKTIDEDFLILLPNPSTEKYHLSAYITCYPSGFNPARKLGLQLSTIHAPVPGYAEKLEKSMDRFFARIEVGKVGKRVNWSVTTGAGLFAAFGGTHARVGEEFESLGAGELDVESTFLRCERQTLHRLPTSKALIFAFHTYTYPIQQIKDEGLGEELASAIDGLKEGNVPEMHFYKRGSVWGEAVKAFLRS
ncbi:heme-dependent oxidative N-demethylase family protein [Aspergillus chevalieri]|uniref:Uncharacterized protein n=1 Tax=Aspergillus chevalieri TaxID=182096 RepID=A0A7R7VJC8_ASPCH|nr:uncharacterized protein ACHE_21152A [Aspergillus chevalieri]BCR85694.1 hypothetical protein ACHE_21152A [Aspergillus chevalieri]